MSISSYGVRGFTTIQTALEKGINLIETAPVYGFESSEGIVGKIIAKYGKRERTIKATNETVKDRVDPSLWLL
jgi:aryl-alcohol dehydrogenase-like predicted oxidoreductase